MTSDLQQNNINCDKGTVGHKSHDPRFHKKYMVAGVMTFVARFTLKQGKLWTFVEVRVSILSLVTLQFWSLPRLKYVIYYRLIIFRRFSFGDSSLGNLPLSNSVKAELASCSGSPNVTSLNVFTLIPSIIKCIGILNQRFIDCKRKKLFLKTVNQFFVYKTNRDDPPVCFTVQVNFSYWAWIHKDLGGSATA